MCKPYFCTPNKEREHSSAGLEHLPYKQRVRGSNPCAPTDYQRISEFYNSETLFYCIQFAYIFCKNWKQLEKKPSFSIGYSLQLYDGGLSDVSHYLFVLENRVQTLSPISRHYFVLQALWIQVY